MLEDEKEEEESKIIAKEADLFFASVQSENRILAVLADKFTDILTLTYDNKYNPLEAPWSSEGYYEAIDYERGLIVKSGKRYKELIGKTIVLQRNHNTHVMKKEAEISGVGLYGLDYMLSWSGSPIYHYVEELLKVRRRGGEGEGKDDLSPLLLDYKLCELMLSQKLWQYGIMDLVL